MSRHTNLIEKISKQKEKTANSSIVVPKGKYSWESSLVMRLGELGTITDKMVDILDNYARLLGYGEEYAAILNVLTNLVDYHEKCHASATTGKDWGDVPHKVNNKSIPKKDIGEGVFGRTWDEIEEMQGGKLTKP